MDDFSTTLREEATRELARLPAPSANLRDVTARARKLKARRTMARGASGIALLLVIAFPIRNSVLSNDYRTAPAAGIGGRENAFSLSVTGEGRYTISEIDTGSRQTGTLASRTLTSDQPARFPDLTLTDDGSLLALVQPSDNGELKLLLINPESGAVEDSEPVSLGVGTSTPTDYVFSSGGSVFLYGSLADGPEATHDFVATYDFARAELLPQTAGLGNCGSLGLVEPLSSSQIAVYCETSRSLKIVTLSPTGSVASESIVGLPESSFAHESAVVSDRVVSIGSSNDRALVYLTTQDGQVFSINVVDAKIVSHARLKLADGEFVAYQGSILTSAPDRLVVAVGDPDTSSTQFSASFVDVVSPANWEKVNRIRLPEQASSFSGGKDGLVQLLAESGDAVYTIDADSPQDAAQTMPIPKGFLLDLEAP